MNPSIERNQIKQAGEARGVLLGSLSETPETVIWLHVLRRGSCKVYTAVDSSGGVNALLQPES